jgi:hypothetical protein
VKPPTPLHRRELELLLSLVNDLARDDRVTRSTMLLMVRGWPGSNDEPGDCATSYPDPTGEAALIPDRAHQDGRRYERSLARAITALLEADRIRASYTARADTKGVANPQDWCRNCYDAGFCSPRAKNGSVHCGWCRDVEQAYRFLPPPEIVVLHHDGKRVDKELVAIAARRKKAKRRHRAA